MELVREFVIEVLIELGYRVLLAADGTEALAALNADQTIDLFFADIKLAPSRERHRAGAERAAAATGAQSLADIGGYQADSIRRRISVDLEAIPAPRTRNAATRNPGPLSCRWWRGNQVRVHSLTRIGAASRGSIRARIDR